MNSFVEKLKFWKDDNESSGDEIFDKDATSLSHVGHAVHDVLRKHHNSHHHKMWNVTRGSIVDTVHQTPRHFDKVDPEGCHSDWFPELMGQLIGQTQYWCDVTSLGPPDGKFMECFKAGLATLAANSVNKDNKPVIVRMMFGNIAGMPVNCSLVIKALTADLPPESNIQLWVGAWRRGFSWNHAKLIAVDGMHLHTGGHNLWEDHYLTCNPVHDLSIQFQGDVARDGHRFANMQWEFVERKQKTCVGSLVDKMPDGLPLLLKTRVTVSEWPEGVASVFPPMFTKEVVGEMVVMPVTMANANEPEEEAVASDPEQNDEQQKNKSGMKSKFMEKLGAGAVADVKASDATVDKQVEESTNSNNVNNSVPLISIGRQGTMVYKARPSDDAILAMINSSQQIIRMTLQDIGPVCVPGSKKSLPGLKWPKAYLTAIGKAIYERGVDVEIVLSNPNSIPGGLKGTEANYGNGWDCVDVAAEIIKRIRKSYKMVDDEKLRAMITENLRICFIRHDKESKYQDGKSIGLHSKHFIVDDTCCYIGSQNLYMCDLAEWGIVIDDETEVKKIKQDYFDPLWKNSFTGEDVDVQLVMDGLKIDRDGKSKLFGGGQNQQAAAMMPHGHGEYYDTEDTAVEVKDGEEPVVGDNGGDDVAGAGAAASKDASEAVPEANATSEGDVAAGSVVSSSPAEESKDQQVIGVDKTKSGDSTGEEKKEGDDDNHPEVVESESHEQSKLANLQIDCNWCGMGEALNMKKALNLKDGEE